MRRLFSKADQRALGPILAVVLALSSMPLTSGVIIVSGPSYPEFTLNICQPPQAFDHVSNPLLRPPAATVLQFVPFSLGSLALKPFARVIEFKEAPDTPPPKPSV